MSESIYAAVMNNKELSQQLLAAQREAAAEGTPESQMVERACELINAAGIVATKEDVADLLAKAGSAQMSDKELDNVSGGCCLSYGCGVCASDKDCPGF